MSATVSASYAKEQTDAHQSERKETADSLHVSYNVSHLAIMLKFPEIDWNPSKSFLAPF